MSLVQKKTKKQKQNIVCLTISCQISYFSWRCIYYFNVLSVATAMMHWVKFYYLEFKIVTWIENLTNVDAIFILSVVHL